MTRIAWTWDRISRLSGIASRYQVNSQNPRFVAKGIREIRDPFTK
jgi:hypothetical protein